MKKRRERRKPATRKGQAVMEYLVTYGLALLVILLVLGILFAVVLPMLKAPEDCKFSDPSFSCDQKQPALVGDTNNNVKYLFQLDNLGGKAVIVEQVTCTTTTPGNLKAADWTNAVSVPVDQGTMSSGQSKSFGSVDSNIKSDVVCYKDDGTTKVVLTANSQFHGTLAIRYKYVDDVPGAPQRTATAIITGTVQAGS